MAKKQTGTVVAFKRLPEKEQILKAIKTNLELYGDIKPPQEVLLQAQEKQCKECGRKGPVMQLFGVYVDRIGVTRAQSRCKFCRASKEAHPTRYGLARPPKPPKPFTKTMFTRMNADQRRRYLELFEELEPR